MWKLTNEAKAWEPLPGVPWRDMDDNEFRDAAKQYSAQGHPARALHGSGFFEHVEDKPSAAGAAKAEGD